MLFVSKVSVDSDVDGEILLIPDVTGLLIWDTVVAMLMSMDGLLVIIVDDGTILSWGVVISVV